MEGEAQVSESSEPVVQTETQQTQTENDSREASQETQSTQNNDQAKPEGFDPVELTPAQKARFDRIYGNMKRYEGDAKQQKALNEALVVELTNIKNGYGEIVSHLHNTNFKDAETRLSQQRTEAWNKGDLEGYNSANDQLNEIRIKKELAADRAKQQPRQQQVQQQPRGLDGGRVVDGARDQGTLTPEEASVTHAWIAETDQNGNAKRPWASNPNDERNYAAALEAQAVFNSPLFANKPIAEKLREVDRRMGIQTQPARSNVLGAGNLTNGNKPNNIKLDPAIEKIAIRTKFGGPKAKSDQDHIDAWKQAVAKQGSRK